MANGMQAAIYMKAEPFDDLVNCPICLMAIQEACLTKCGHSFCKDCITEYVDRSHKCPVCNQTLDVHLIFPDLKLQHIIDTLREQREKGEKRYFDGLVSTASGEQLKEHVFSPVEQVLRNHLKASLETHERYYQNLKKELDVRLSELDDDLTATLSQLQASATCSDASVQTELDKHDAKKRKLQLEMDECANQVAAAYDRYLDERLPKMCFLPVTIKLSFPAKGVEVQNLILKPEHTVENLLKVIENRLVSDGDEVVERLPEPLFYSFGPFSKRSKTELIELIQELGVDCSQMPAGVERVFSSGRILLKNNIKSGSELVLVTGLRCLSDMPQRCLIQTFDKSKQEPVNYYQCADCNFRWICRPCSQSCHKGHNTSLFMKNHIPEWKCCYCPKKKKCKINV